MTFEINSTRESIMQDTFHEILEFNLGLKSTESQFIMDTVRDIREKSEKIEVTDILNPATLQKDLTKLFDGGQTNARRHLILPDGKTYYEYAITPYDALEQPLSGHYTMNLEGKIYYVPKALFVTSLEGLLSTYLQIESMNSNPNLVEEYLANNPARIVTVGTTITATSGIDPNIKEIDGIKKSYVIQNSGNALKQSLKPFFELVPTLNFEENRVPTKAYNTSIMSINKGFGRMLIEFTTRFFKEFGTANHQSHPYFFFCDEGKVPNPEVLASMKMHTLSALTIDSSTIKIPEL